MNNRDMQLTADVLNVQVDPVFEGQAGGASSLVKYNPLSNVSSAEVWNFLRVMVRPFLRYSLQDDFCVACSCFA